MPQIFSRKISTSSCTPLHLFGFLCMGVGYIMRKLPAAPGKLMFLLMVTTYFTKWIETSNKTIMNSVKKHLGKVKGNRAEEPLAVLWVYRTTSRTPIGETPFSLVYGAEAMISVFPNTLEAKDDKSSPRYKGP